MNNALLKDNLAARAVDSQTRKVFSRSGLIAGLCLSSLVSSYAIPGGVDATKAKNESVMITQQAKRVSGVVTENLYLVLMSCRKKPQMVQLPI